MQTHKPSIGLVSGNPAEWKEGLYETGVKDITRDPTETTDLGSLELTAFGLTAWNPAWDRPTALPYV